MANQIRTFGLRQINPTGKSLLIFRNRVKPLCEKYFCFAERKITLYVRRPVPLKGRCATSTTRGGMRWTLMALLTRAPDSGRRSRVVLAPRRRRQVSRGYSCGATETNQPDLRGEHEVSRKTIAWGMPGESGVTCMLVCAFYPILHTRPWGASSARHSLRPFRGRGGRNQANLAQQPAAGSRRCVLPSLRAQRSNPPSRLPRHGLLRCARNDEYGR